MMTLSALERSANRNSGGAFIDFLAYRSVALHRAVLVRYYVGRGGRRKAGPESSAKTPLARSLRAMSGNVYVAQRVNLIFEPDRDVAVCIEHGSDLVEVRLDPRRTLNSTI